jgi:hypothetical protein
MMITRARPNEKMQAPVLLSLSEDETRLVPAGSVLDDLAELARIVVQVVTHPGKPLA